jgi:26S proteasome regulatory subunit N2
MAATAYTSAAPMLSLLEEPDSDLRGDALSLMNETVHLFWSELASSVVAIETLADDETFPHQQLAASVASKIYYYMSEPKDAVRLALSAGAFFSTSSVDSYTQAVIARCVDDYVAAQRAMTLSASASEDGAEVETSAAELDPRVQSVVERVIEQAVAANRHRDALGLALEACRLDLVESILLRAPAPAPLMKHLYTLAMTVVSSKPFRDSVVRVLVRLYQAAPSDANVRPGEDAGDAAASAATTLSVTSDVLALCQCLFYLDNAEKVAEILSLLAASSAQRDNLLGLQVAFELVENQHVAFMARVSAAVTPQPPAAAPAATAAGAGAATESDLIIRMRQLKHVLSGGATAALNTEFLSNNNKADLSIIDVYANTHEPRTPATYAAVLVAQGLMLTGTKSDYFFRKHPSLARGGTHWQRFAAVSTVGMLHRGRATEAEMVLSQFLSGTAAAPAAGAGAGAGAAAAAAGRHGEAAPAPQSSYEEGGALYAMGLMSCGVSSCNTEHLRARVKREGADEVQLHGALLGLGLSAVGTHDKSLFADIHEVLLLTESAVVGEAAGYAIGLIFLGSGDDDVQEVLRNTIEDSPHEKTIRGAAIGLALMSYGREGDADALANRLLRDKDPTARYGGAWVLALAYAATSDASAVKRLLRAAVTDAADDVRRAAVTALGFVLINTPEQVPKLVSLLAESYNPYVRYGAAMAVGIACAGSGDEIASAYALLEPLLTDKTDFVRQAAYIATSMVLQQVTDPAGTKGKVKAFRKQLAQSFLKRGEAVVRLGSLFASGMLDAGGRNSTVSLRSGAGHKRMVAIAGAALFCQYWYWHPLMSMASLALSPTAAIGVTSDLKIPTDFKLVSAKPPSTFAYPSSDEEKKEQEIKQRVVNVLSIAKKKKKKFDGTTLSVSGSLLSRAASAVAALSSTVAANKTDDKAAGNADDKGDAAAKPARVAAAATGSSSLASLAGSPVPMADTDKPTGEDVKEDADKGTKPPVVAEDKVAILSNPTRIVPAQKKFIIVPPTQRFVPVKQRMFGVVVLEDTRPGEPFDVFAPPAAEAAAADGKASAAAGAAAPAAAAAKAADDSKGKATPAAPAAAADAKKDDKSEEEDDGKDKKKAEEEPLLGAGKNMNDKGDDDDEDEPGVPPSFNMQM